jgi:hypothetical protein
MVVSLKSMAFHASQATGPQERAGGSPFRYHACAAFLMIAATSWGRDT